VAKANFGKEPANIGWIQDPGLEGGNSRVEIRVFEVFY